MLSNDETKRYGAVQSRYNSKQTDGSKQMTMEKNPLPESGIWLHEKVIRQVGELENVKALHESSPGKALLYDTMPHCRGVSPIEWNTTLDMSLTSPECLLSSLCVLQRI